MNSVQCLFLCKKFTAFINGIAGRKSYVDKALSNY